MGPAFGTRPRGARVTTLERLDEARRARRKARVSRPAPRRTTCSRRSTAVRRTSSKNRVRIGRNSFSPPVAPS